MNIEAFYDKDTSTLTYLVYDPVGFDAVVIDPVLDYDPASGKVTDLHSEKIQKRIEEKKLKLHYILETHAHADHLSSSQWFKRKNPSVKIAIGSRIKEVQSSFKKIYNLGDELACDGSQFDLLLEDGQQFQAGTIKIRAISTAGHTPACMSFLIEDSLFTGDALFMPDYGTGRCDFPSGSARELYQSIQKKLYQFADTTKVYVGHDYCPNGREMKYQTTIGESKTTNIHLKAETTEGDYVRFREGRDQTLNAPRLLFPSIQINIQAGALPKAEDNGIRYLKLPIFDKTH